VSYDALGRNIELRVDLLGKHETCCQCVFCVVAFENAHQWSRCVMNG